LFPKRPDDALRAGIALQREVRLLNAKLVDDGLPELVIGVGLHTGDLMLGTIGERGRMETTVIADAVNVAARLESATKTFACSILLSRETRDALSEPDRFMLRPLGSVFVKGKAHGIEIYECYDADPAELAMHKRTTVEHFVNAVTAYERGNPSAASAAFTTIVAANEQDGAAAYALLPRCH
jgi:two-component system sensor histidine kinase ChiS